jgi:hypothetical protein
MITSCSRTLLESALAGQLPTDDETLLYCHLEECATCSSAIEQMVDGAAWQQEAGTLLLGQDLVVPTPLREEWSDIDFTVEHLEPADDPTLLGRLGDYDVLEIIGRGGMGVVLKGYDRELKRCVAIKVLAPHLAQSSLAKKRFAREAQAAAAVVHPHVLAIHQVQPTGRLPFLVMPLVAGESLAQRLAAKGTLELKEILRIGMQAAAGLSAAHEQGLVHRDVKPANILLEKGVERAVLTDFGLACAADDVSLTRYGIIAGTPQYMSPEQARGEPLDGRSDLFSLGCVLYEMATGVSPFRTESVIATMRRLVDDEPQSPAAINPELPPWFIMIVERLLAKKPARRFGSAKEVSDLLENCLAHVQQPTSVALPETLAVASKPVLNNSPPRGSRWGWKAVLLAFFGCCFCGMLFFMHATEAPDISGTWKGTEWGTVVLTKVDSDYTGTYSDTLGKAPGEIRLKWSRIERRFNGTWREGEDRFGELSIRLVDQEIRGALTTDARSKINPAAPRLADLTWSKATGANQVDAAALKATFGPVIERVISFDHSAACYDLDTGKFIPAKSPDDFWAEQTVRAVGGELFHNPVSSNLNTLTAVDLLLVPLKEKSWEDTTPETVREAVGRAQHEKVPLQRWSANVSPGVYAFAMLKGVRDETIMGVLEILGAVGPDKNTINGVGIRYKLGRSSGLIPTLDKTEKLAAKPVFGSVMEGILPSGVPCREQFFQFRSGKIFISGNGPGTSKEEAASDEQKIEDAGGVDMSASSSEVGIRIAGRGCIFTQDVQGLKWDRITAVQAVNSMNRISFVEGLLSLKKTELPSTYLFKTARGEVGIMEVQEVVADEQSDSSRSMKFRYKLVQGTGTSNVAATPPLVFGPEFRGLQAAVEVTPGEPFKLRIYVRNVSDRSISIDGARYRQDDECMLTDAHGQPVPVTKLKHDIRIGMKGGYFGAGQIAVFESAGLSFQTIDKASASAGYVAQANPGRYMLRLRMRLPGDDVPFAASERAWQGELETGSVTIEVKDPATQPITPVADSIFSAVLGPEVECVMNDLQTTRENCALSFDSGKLMPVPANFTLEALTTPSTQPAVVSWAQENKVDAVAFVSTTAGQLVKCGLLCPGLIVIKANNKEWVWDATDPRMLKDKFEQAMQERKEYPPIAELTSDDQFPANFLILDTRTHRRGVLQIMGVTDKPSGVKIRYKLVQGAAMLPQPQASARKASCGPVIERVLELPEQNSLPKFWLDLDRGTNVATGDFKGDKDETCALVRWLQKHGADLCAASNIKYEEAPGTGAPHPIRDELGIPLAERGLGYNRGLGLLAMPVKAALWESAKPEAILAHETALESQADQGSNMLVPAHQTSTELKGTLKATFVFKTAEGNMGLLQITDITAEPRQVKFQYKLVQRNLLKNDGLGSDEAKKNVALSYAKFGSVFERQMANATASFPTDPKTTYLDLDSGDNSTESPPGDLANAVSGIDDCRIGLNLITLEVAEERCDATVNQVRLALEGKQPQERVTLRYSRNKQTTYFVKTHRGSIGILQMQGDTKTPTPSRSDTNLCRLARLGCTMPWGTIPI